MQPPRLQLLDERRSPTHDEGNYPTQRRPEDREAMIRLAMIHLMLNRLCPKDDQHEFIYR